MAFSLTSVSPAIVSAAGGYLIEIVGAFELGNRYQVYLGNTGTTLDPVCYSGVRGQGSVVYPLSAVLMRAYTPRVASDTSAYTVTVLNLDTLEGHVLAGSVTAEKVQYQSTVFGLRGVAPPRWKTGPRTLESVVAI